MSREEARTTLVQQQREADALLKTQFEVCKKNMGDQLRYMGTATVVRDIDFITRKLEGEDALMCATFRLLFVYLANASQ